MKEVNYVPRQIDVAILYGYEISIAPLANIIEKENGIVYGILAHGTHEELKRLYAHAENILGGTYLPKAVMVKKITGEYLPALTYISGNMIIQKADKKYIERITKPAEKYNFPTWYINKLKGFKF